MTDDRQAEELTDRALRRLRDRIMTGTIAPPATVLRTHADRWLRARRATAAGLAAAAVAALALGGTAVWRPAAGPPDPAGSPSPSPTASTNVPIDQVDWTRATIDLPSGYDCPSGPVEFVPQDEFAVPPHETDEYRWQWATAMGPQEGFPAAALELDPELDPPPVYGDLTGDGEPEAVLKVLCFETAETSVAGDALLVVTREPDGTLTGLGWAGTPDNIQGTIWTSYLDYWIDDGRLLIDAAHLSNPGTPRPDPTAYRPGLATTYRWDGEELIEDGPAAEYPPVLTRDGQTGGPPMRLGPVADGLGCPHAELRFTLNEATTIPVQPDLDFSGGGVAEVDGGVFRLRPNHYRQHLFALDDSGVRRLLVTIECERADGGRAEGLAVFEPAADGWQGVSVVPSPTEPDQHYLVAWQPDGPDVIVSWTYDSACTQCDFESVTDQRYRWNGNELVPVDE